MPAQVLRAKHEASLMKTICLSYLQDSLKNFKTGVNMQLTLQLIGYIDANEDVTSEVHLLTDSEITAQVTQMQLDAAEHDDKNEEDDVDREMSPPRRDQVCQAIEILQSCCLYQDDGEWKMQKKVTEIEKL